MSSVDHRDTQVVIPGKPHSSLYVFRFLRCDDEGRHPFFLKISVVEKLIGRHAGQPIGVIVSSGDERIFVTLGMGALVGTCGLTAIIELKTGVLEADRLIVSGRITEIHKFVQTKTTLSGAVNRCLKICDFRGVWPAFVSRLAVFLGQTLKLKLNIC